MFQNKFVISSYSKKNYILHFQINVYSYIVQQGRLIFTFIEKSYVALKIPLWQTITSNFQFYRFLIFDEFCPGGLYIVQKVQTQVKMLYDCHTRTMINGFMGRGGTKGGGQIFFIPAIKQPGKVEGLDCRADKIPFRCPGSTR